MSSYHSSFTYLNKNSSGEGFVIASFEPDSGFVDSFLGMDQITTESYDGTKKHFYGSKYNTSAEILITLVKPDGSDFSMMDNRRVMRWLTGSRQASWLDLYVGDKLVYSFYGSVTGCQQQKQDARVIGIQIAFTSLHPWAWSAPQSFNCYVGDKMLQVDGYGVIHKTHDEFEYFGITDDGVVYNNSDNEDFSFSITNDGAMYNDSSVNLEIDNKSDDLYTLTNLDIVYNNIDSTSLIIKNLSLEESTVITGISTDEVVNLSAGQFIISKTYPTKVFGDDFNFVWPKLRPGINKLYIDGNGKGYVQFTYRYPIKIGDCAIDVENLGRNPMCEGEISGAIGSSDGITTLGRKNVILIDSRTGKPHSAYIKDNYLYISESDDERRNRVVLTEKQTGTLHEIIVNNNTFYFVEASNIDSSTAARESIVLIDTVNNTPYELMVKDNTPNDSMDKDYSLHLSEI